MTDSQKNGVKIKRKRKGGITLMKGIEWEIEDRGAI